MRGELVDCAPDYLHKGLVTLRVVRTNGLHLRPLEPSSGIQLFPRIYQVQPFVFAFITSGLKLIRTMTTNVHPNAHAGFATGTTEYYDR